MFFVASFVFSRPSFFDEVGRSLPCSAASRNTRPRCLLCPLLYLLGYLSFFIFHLSTPPQDAYKCTATINDDSKRKSYEYNLLSLYHEPQFVPLPALSTHSLISTAVTCGVTQVLGRSVLPEQPRHAHVHQHVRCHDHAVQPVVAGVPAHGALDDHGLRCTQHPAHEQDRFVSSSPSHCAVLLSFSQPYVCVHTCNASREERCVVGPGRHGALHERRRVRERQARVVDRARRLRLGRDHHERQRLGRRLLRRGRHLEQRGLRPRGQVPGLRQGRRLPSRPAHPVCFLPTVIWQ